MFDTKPWTRGSIILMHDGGGDRSATVAALPVLINALRAHGYKIVPVSELIGKTRAEVMPPVNGRQRYYAFVDSIAFFLISFFNHFVISVFFIGDILMSGRLIIIGLFAIIDRFRKRKNFATPDYQPRVAVLIPAYNEEKVIARTIRSVLMSNYKNIRIIVIDDGSTDNTYKIASRNLRRARSQPAASPSSPSPTAARPTPSTSPSRKPTKRSTSASTPTASSPTTPSPASSATSPTPTSAPSPATPRSATASTSGPAGRPSNTSPARTSSAAL